MADVVADVVVVAVEMYSVLVAVVHEAAVDSPSNSFELHARTVRNRSPKVVDMAVVRMVAGRHERRSVAAFEDYAAFTRVEYVAAIDLSA